jgi:hypothetical protein
MGAPERVAGINGPQPPSSRPQTPTDPTAEPTLTLSTGPTARRLLGLTRRGGPHEPYRSADGWDHYRWKSLDGGSVEVALRNAAHPEHAADDELAAETLRWAPTTDRSYVQLNALLVCLVRLDGVARQWHWCRVTETLHGDKAHAERHNLPIQGLLALLVRGRWNLGHRSAAPVAKRRGRPKVDPGPAGRQLVEFTDRTRSSGTVVLEPSFRAELEVATAQVAATALRLGASGVPNPEGNLPSRAMRARLRLSAVFACTLRRSGEAKEPDTEVLESLVTSSGGDLERITRRRHRESWGLAALEELKAAVVTVGIGLLAFEDKARSVLHFPLQLGSPLPASAVEGAAGAALSSRAPP